MTEIWWVNQYAITPDLPGGTRHYDLGVELAKRGYRVRILASDFSLSLRKRTKLKPGQMFAVEERDGIEFVWIASAEYEKNNWRRAWNMVSFSWNLLRVSRILAAEARPDIVIGSSPHPFGALGASRVAHETNARFFLELRDLWPQALVDMGGLREGHPAVRVMRAMERYLYACAERLIILAQGSAQYLTARGVDASRIVYVPNGVHLGHFVPRQSRAESRQRFGFTQFTVAYAGAHGPANALQTVISAAQLVDDLPIEFVLVGDGPEKEALQRQASEMGVRNVRFLPPVSKGDVPDLLTAADAGVITLKNAAAFAYGISPNKLFDYMAAARPILCAVPGDMAQIVREAEAGLVVPPEDPEALASAVRHLYSLPGEMREAMGERGRAYLAKHFSRERLVDRLVGIFGP